MLEFSPSEEWEPARWRLVVQEAIGAVNQWGYTPLNQAPKGGRYGEFL